MKRPATLTDLAVVVLILPFYILFWIARAVIGFAAATFFLIVGATLQGVYFIMDLFRRRQ